MTRTPVLSAEARAWFESVERKFDLEGHERMLLVQAAQAWDEIAEAKTVIAKEGLTIRTDRGGKKSNPVPSFEASATSPHWPLGIPTPWETIDADDPPRFESQAAYLKRDGLFLPGEEERLTAADFEPEVVDEQPQEIIAFCKKHGIL